MDEPVVIVRRGRHRHFDRTLREALRARVDPDELVDTLLAAMRDPSASWKDRLAAVKQISDRRDGLPIATILAAGIASERILADLPDVALAQLEAVLREQLQLDDGDSDAEH